MRIRRLNPYCLAISIALASLLFISCQKSTEPESTPGLFITNGFFDTTPVDTSDTSQLAIVFQYGVTGAECNVGGYCIRLNQNDLRCVYWYIMHRLKPGDIYTIADTLKLEEEITTYPAVIMEGYKIIGSETYPWLRAEYLLQPRKN